MSIQAVGWVLDHSESRGLARLVLVALANHANDQRECWPAQRTIAREAGISPGSVGAQVRKLVALGEVTVLEAGTPRRAARYRLRLWTDPEPERSAGERSPEPPARDPERAQRATQDRAEPSLNQDQEIATPEASPSEPKPKRTRARTPRDDLFDALVVAFGPASTPSRQSFYGRACTELVAAGATPEQIIQARAEMTRRGWESPSPQALVKSWDDLLATSRPANPAATRFWEQ